MKTIHVYKCIWHHGRCTKISSVRKLANARVRNFYAYENFCDYSIFLFFLLLTKTVSFPPIPGHHSGGGSPPLPPRGKCLFCTVSVKYTVQKTRGFAWGPHWASHEKRTENNIVSLKNTPLAGLVIHSTIVKMDTPSAMQSQCLIFILFSFYYQVTMKLNLPG